MLTTSNGSVSSRELALKVAGLLPANPALAKAVVEEAMKVIEALAPPERNSYENHPALAEMNARAMTRNIPLSSEAVERLAELTKFSSFSNRKDDVQRNLDAADRLMGLPVSVSEDGAQA